MPLDTCITNVGEYYSSHYLDSTFTKDVKDLVAKWKDQGSQAPPRRLQRLSDLFFRAKTQALEEPRLDCRWQLDGEMSGWHGNLLEALGYTDRQAMDLPVEGGQAHVPILGRINRYNRPWLVICETAFCLPDGSLKEGMPSEDPLDTAPRREQLTDKALKLCEGDWSRVIGRVFTEEESPRWMLFLAGTQILLLDRNTYAQGRYLAFDLDDAFGRKEKATFDHLAAFLAFETLCLGGESDEVLHDRLEEQSHRFAHGVTEALQFAVREAIELLANEWVEDRRRRKLPTTKLRPDEALPGGEMEVTAERLKHEALVFVYRLLFCFYAEARGGELGILPIDEDCYRLGYSLESIRDLEQVPLSEANQEGAYFHEHLKQLFGIIHRGFHPSTGLFGGIESEVRTFTVRPLTATLFALESTPLLDKARLTNRCLQQVIRRLSLSVDAQSRSIGRVNYAELGINQLGAVYEGLLSYQGMFADKNLIHVKPADGDFRDKKTPTWFVPVERADEFKKEEVERLEDGKPRVYIPGAFILHLSGIDREQSASFYTPEVLTHCLVEEVLRELLKDYGPEDADKILELTMCEPAMGSAAFANELTDQLAAKYLELKQKQLGKTIDPARYADELRRVKHYIATRNVYGVDLNPTAVELGALSLWLGCIHRLLVAEGQNGGPDIYQPSATPWFGLRLRCGNSLIGARRAVWTADQLRKGKHGGKDSEVPRLLKPGEERDENEVYHFLVFDEDMVPTHKDALMKQFWPERCGKAKNWIEKQVKPKWKSEEIKEALAICELIDEHWARYAAERADALQKTACTASVWPTPANSPQATSTGPSLAEQERIKAELESTSGSFQRLKLVMDTWCALWFWPLGRAGDLPTRDGLLASVRLLLGDRPPQQDTRVLISARLGFEIDALLAAATGQVPDVTLLADAVPWLELANQLAGEQHFHHWELTFPEVLGPSACGGGFDLIVGNPPWIKVTWADAAALGDLEPLLGVRDAKSAEYNHARPELLSNTDNREKYGSSFCACCGSMAVLNCKRCYAALSGVPTNIYKTFIARSWEIIGDSGIIGLIHEEGVFDDPGGGSFRKLCYPRLCSRLQFKNELQLFPDVGHAKPFSLNTYRGVPHPVHFRMICNLFHPETVERCFRHKRVSDPVPGMKTASGEWERAGHASRIIEVDEQVLALFAQVFEESGTPFIESRLPQIHSKELLTVLDKFLRVKEHFAEHDDEYLCTEMFHEANTQRDGIITRQHAPSFAPRCLDEWIISGPHYYVGTPFNKTPRTACNSKGAYDDVDLTEIPEDYLPRAVFKPGDRQGSRARFEKAITSWPDGVAKKPVVACFRNINRVRVMPSNERTLISALIPPGPTHIDGSMTTQFLDTKKLVIFHGVTMSICSDFVIRVCGTTHCRNDVLGMLPVIRTPWDKPLENRVLRLCCLTKAFASLWTEVAKESASRDDWTSSDTRLCNEYELPWNKLAPTKWEWMTPVRSDFARRQALLEVDVLISLALELSADELVTIYRVQFPVMREYETADEYDGRGRHIPNTTRKNQGGPEFRAASEEWKSAGNDPCDPDAPPLTVSWEIDDGLQTVTKTFYPPFTKVDREADYAQAYEVFRKRYGV
jgi:hypothetical protein